MRLKRLSLGLIVALFTSTSAMSQDVASVAAHVEQWERCPIVDRYEYIDAGVGEEIFGQFVSLQRGELGWLPPPSVPSTVVMNPETWVRPETRIAEHRVIRRALGDVPETRPKVMLLWRHQHWTAFTQSVIAVRHPDGLWRVDSVRLNDVGPPEHSVGMLDEEASSELDSLVKDPCLAHEPFRTTYQYLGPVMDGEWTLEVQSEAGEVRMSGANRGFGRARLIRGLLLSAT